MAGKVLSKRDYIQVFFVFLAFALMAAIGGISFGNTMQKASLSTVTVALGETEKTIRAYLREPKVAFDNIHSSIQDLLDRGESQDAVLRHLKHSTELLRTQELAASAPDIRAERIAELKEKINDPSYIDDKVINATASKLIDALFG